MALSLTALVGIVTFLRCVQGSVEDVVLGERVERVRGAYLELLPGLVDYLDAPLDTSTGDARDARRMTGRYAWQLALTMAGLVSIVNSALIGLVVGFLLQLCSVDPQIVWPVGALVALLSAVVHFSRATAFIRERGPRRSTSFPGRLSRSYTRIRDVQGARVPHDRGGKTGSSGLAIEQRKEPEVALSDQLTALATRAKDLEDRAAAAKSKSKADLEQDVKNARESAQSQADSFRAAADKSKGQISDWWQNVQKSWDKHLKDVRKHVDDKKKAHDLKSAQRAAQQADDDAAFAIDYTYGAIEEAEYAVLDADLAHLEADEFAESNSTS